MKNNLNIPFNNPLQEGDNLLQTKGCRHTRPELCSKHSLRDVCALVRKDEICKAPPATWKKQFSKLAEGK